MTGILAGIAAVAGYFSQIALPLTSSPTLSNSPETIDRSYDQNDMQWFYDRFGQSTWLDPSKFNVNTFTPAEYQKLIESSAYNESASVALRLTILNYLKDHPNDPKYQSLKKELYSADFLAAQNQYFQQIAAALPNSVLDNRSLFMKIVSKNGYDIRWASERLRNDEGLAREAFEHCRNNDCINLMIYLPDRIRGNRKFMLDEAKAGHGSISDLRGGLNNDKEIVLALIQNAPFNMDSTEIHFIGKNIINDPEIVTLIRKSFMSPTGLGTFADTDDVPPTLRNDVEFMTHMISKNCVFLSIAPTKMKDDVRLVRAVVIQQGPICLEYASQRLQNDPALLSIIRDHDLKSTGGFGTYIDFQNVPQALRNDVGFMTQMISKNCSFLSIAPDKLRDDENLVREAITQQNSNCLQFASERLQKKLASQAASNARSQSMP